MLGLGLEHTEAANTALTCSHVSSGDRKGLHVGMRAKGLRCSVGTNGTQSNPAGDVAPPDPTLH